MLKEPPLMKSRCCVLDTLENVRTRSRNSSPDRVLVGYSTHPELTIKHLTAILDAPCEQHMYACAVDKNHTCPVPAIFKKGCARGYGQTATAMHNNEQSLSSPLVSGVSGRCNVDLKAEHFGPKRF